MQFGTNHLGHFALTGRLLPSLLAASGPRVVTVSSGAHRMGRIDFDNLDGSRGYQKWRAYGMSKLANLLFTFELDRRSSAAGARLTAVAAHPGWASTNLQAAGPRMAGSRLMERASAMGNLLLGQSAEKGALSTVYAAVVPDLEGGTYIGPNGVAELWGSPVRVRATAAARDPQTAARLWDVSESLTGVSFAALTQARA
jgi:NAD(P)-dependent dehydrogenase (short-subunit alcohol dehydrogenase family)